MAFITKNESRVINGRYATTIEDPDIVLAIDMMGKRLQAAFVSAKMTRDLKYNWSDLDQGGCTEAKSVEVSKVTVEKVSAPTVAGYLCTADVEITQWTDWTRVDSVEEALELEVD